MSDRSFQHPDPRWPNRPQHPDFLLLADAVIEQDQKADAGTPVPEIVAEFADEASLLYMLRQRASRLTRDPASQAAIVAAMLDGFTLGVGYARRKYPEGG